jgi:hypothetical protein
MFERVVLPSAAIKHTISPEVFSLLDPLNEQFGFCRRESVQTTLVVSNTPRLTAITAGGIVENIDDPHSLEIVRQATIAVTGSDEHLPKTALDKTTLYYAKGWVAPGMWQLSQRWHLDTAYSENVKGFVVSDVLPTEIVSGELKGPWARAFLRESRKTPSNENIIIDEALEKGLLAINQPPTLAVATIDNNVWHRSSVNPSKEPILRHFIGVVAINPQ